MAATATTTHELSIESDDALRWYERTSTVAYGFCSRCGSTLFWRATDKPEHMSIAAGTLDQPTGLTTTLALFGDQASDYHQRDQSIETFGGDRQLGSSDG